MACVEQTAVESMSTAEAAARAGVGLSTVQSAVSLGRLRAQRHGSGRPMTIAESDFLAWRQSIEAPAPPAPGLLTVKQAAAQAGISTETVEGAIFRGALRVQRHDGRVFIDREDVVAWRESTERRTERSAAKEARAAERAAAKEAREAGRVTAREAREIERVATREAGEARAAERAAKHEAQQQRAAAWRAKVAENVAKRDAEYAERAEKHQRLQGAAALEAAHDATQAKSQIGDAIAAIDAARLAGISWLTMRLAIARGDFTAEHHDGTRVVSREFFIAWARAKRLILGDSHGD